MPPKGTQKSHQRSLPNAFQFSPPDGFLAHFHLTLCPRSLTFMSYSNGLPCPQFPERLNNGRCQQDMVDREGETCGEIRLLILLVPSLPDAGGGLCPSNKGHSSNQDITTIGAPNPDIANIRVLPHPLWFPLMLPIHHHTLPSQLFPAKIPTKSRLVSENGNKPFFSSTTVSPALSLPFLIRILT